MIFGRNTNRDSVRFIEKVQRKKQIARKSTKNCPKKNLEKKVKNSRKKNQKFEGKIFIRRISNVFQSIQIAMDKLLAAPTKEDLKLMMKREYRQRHEQARKERIFNPRQRIIGIDKMALDEHVHLKQHERLARQKEDLCFTIEQDRQTDALNTELNQLAEENLQRERELNEYRCKFQRKEHGDSFDLNDPKYLRKMSPTDGLSWLGEDPSNLHRIHMQREQQKSWLQQQIYEKNLSNQHMTDAENAIQMKALSEDEQMKRNVEMEQKKRQQIQIETAKYNYALAQAQREKGMQKRRREDEDNMAEIMNHLSSDMLNERKDTGVESSVFGGARRIPTMYRGMTDEEVTNIRHEQLRQIEEKLAQSEKIRKSNRLYDELMTQRNNLMEIEERNLKNHKEQMITEQNMMNARLLEEQKERKRHLDQAVYTFQPDEKYFEQFNTTTR